MVTQTETTIKTQVLALVTEDWRKAKRPRCFSEIESLWQYMYRERIDPEALADALAELETEGSLVLGDIGDKIVHVPSEARIGDLPHPFTWCSGEAKGVVR